MAKRSPLQIATERIEAAAQLGASYLHLGGLGLASLPPGLTGLRHLQSLYLANNQLTALPPDFANLQNLQTLDLAHNQLTALPPDFANLQNLQSLYLAHNQLTALPPDFANLQNLQTLELDDNQLTALPLEFSQLHNLQFLNLCHNNLSALPSQFEQLQKLQDLDLGENCFLLFPIAVSELRKLETLHVHANQLTSLPPELARLRGLVLLNVGENKLTRLPSEIVALQGLQFLGLDENDFARLPIEVTQLVGLRTLYLDKNNLSELPARIGDLQNLQTLGLRGNPLTHLPPELGRLKQLTTLELDGLPLESPEPAIVKQGTAAVLRFLREQLAESEKVWLSKLLIVGEGGVGKTQLLRLLRGEDFQVDASTTRGMEIHSVSLPHPQEPGVTMQLNAWDFGGQEIYHATHQFFLTGRSLFLLVWNARHGFEQGKLYYWLDAIQARAPGAPVVLVATQTDERPADLPYEELRKKYPQIEAGFSVSNKSGDGIERLRDALAALATGLPLMGKTWPASWVLAAKKIVAQKRNFVSASAFRKLLKQSKVKRADYTAIAMALHDLGDILFYHEDPELEDLVILRPQWVSAVISKVLDSVEVAGNSGIFTATHMRKLWKGHPGALRKHFLRLMERFDLSYQTTQAGEDISIVVERLSLDPPKNKDEEWAKGHAAPDPKQVALKFQFGSTIPAGLPTWFIARSHRFTTRTHWRLGAVFADQKREHRALVQSFLHDRYITFQVVGPTPHNFLALLVDGFELTLERFPGLPVQRRVPCCGHAGMACDYEFDMADLVRALAQDPPVEHMQCSRSLKQVHVATLLFGIHWRTLDTILVKLEELQKELADLRDRGVQQTGLLLSEITNLRELAQREFLNAYKRDQANVDLKCPNVFLLYPDPKDAQLTTLGGFHGSTLWTDLKDAFVGKRLHMHLLCQYPGHWHPTGDSGQYTIQNMPMWLVPMGPYLRGLAKVLKQTLPVASVATPLVAAAWAAGPLKDALGLMEKLVDHLPTEENLREGFSKRALDPGALSGLRDASHSAEAKTGAELRFLRHVLKELDPKETWGGLEPIITPEGHILWLCGTHAKEFKK